MKRARVSIYAFLLGWLLGLTACFPAIPQRYGREFNPQRAQYGLPMIPSDWQLNGNTGSMHGRGDRWLNPKNELRGPRPVPIHFSKGIQYTKDEILRESDLYYGPREFSHFTGAEVLTYWEFISITYCFKVIPEWPECSETGWHVKYLDGTNENNPRPISLREAERILRTWGIERLP